MTQGTQVKDVQAGWDQSRVNAGRAVLVGGKFSVALQTTF